MIRNLKALGLAMAAMFALSAVGVSAASAAEFHSEATHTTLHAEQTNTHVFTTDVGTVTCETATFHGTTASKTTPEITITPTYTGCDLHSIFGEIAVTVNFNGCDYNFTEEAQPVHIVCPESKTISVSGPGCKVTVPGQTVGTVSYTNTGSGSSRTTDVNATVSGIKYSYSGFLCGSGSNTTNGTYNGTAEVSGSSGGVQVGVWYE